jgi:hypothetical protein
MTSPTRRFPAQSWSVHTRSSNCRRPSATPTRTRTAASRIQIYFPKPAQRSPTALAWVQCPPAVQVRRPQSPRLHQPLQQLRLRHPLQLKTSLQFKRSLHFPTTHRGFSSRLAAEGHVCPGSEEGNRTQRLTLNWRWPRCDAVVYRPSLNTRYTCFDAPASVRISTTHLT